METYYPYISDRYRSIFIDGLVVVGLMVLFSTVFSFFTDVPDEARIIAFIVLFLYEPVCTSIGGTIGQYSAKIRVRKSSNTQQKINIFQALLRAAIKYTLGVFSLLVIHAHVNTKRRAIHDFLSGSVVISLNPAHANYISNSNPVAEEVNGNVIE